MLNPGFGCSAAAFVLVAIAGCGGDEATTPPAPVVPGDPPPAVVACVSSVSTPAAASTLAAPGLPTGLGVATSARFATASACAGCHRADTSTTPATNIDLVTGEAMGLTNDWAGTMMANSARDPYFLAALTAEMGAIPSLAGVIQNKCLKCHAPMASYEARVTGGTFVLADLSSSALGQDGVSCLACHRIEPDNLGTAASFSGSFAVSDATGTTRRVYGPYVSVATNPMINQIAMTPIHGAHIRESRLCGSCHTLHTEAVDPETQALTGIVFPEQMPYKEWLNSSFTSTASCQSCHLPTATGSVRLSAVGPTRGQASFAKHHMAGGNAFMLGLLRQDRAGANSLQLAADLSNFDASIARTKDLLSRDSATLAARACREGSLLSLDVTVGNQTGHKLPTGYPNRRTWLHVKVIDAQGATLFESGNVDATQEIVGLDSPFEPHRQVIDRPDQVQVYEAVLGDVANRMTLRLMHAARYLKDNRLLPAGMARDIVDTDVKPVGVAADSDFGDGRDTVTYRVALAGFQAPYSIAVELLYQSVPPRHVNGLASYTSTQITRFTELYGSADNTPRKLATVESTVN